MKPEQIATRVRRVYLSTYIWSDAGGIEQTLIGLARAFQRLGIDVVVIGWKPLGPAKTLYDEQLKQSRITLIVPNGFWGHLAWDWDYRVSVINQLLNRVDWLIWLMGGFQKIRKRCDLKTAKVSVRNSLRHLFLSLTRLYTIENYMRLRVGWANWWRPASVFNQHSLTVPTLMEWAHKRAIPIVYTEQVVVGDNVALPTWQPIKEMMPLVQGFTALSEAVRKSMVKHLDVDQSRIAIIPGPVDFFDSRFPSSASQSESKRQLRVLSVGRLHAAKGFLTLIEAAALLKIRGCKFEVVLAGDGPEREGLMAAVKDKSLETDVQFKLGVPHYELPALYRSADIFVLPSFSEGLGLVVVEALSFGLPVIVSDLPAFTGLVSQGSNGLKFPAGNAVALANALEYLLSNPPERLRMGQQSKARFESGEFQVDTIAQQYLTVYEQALAGASAKALSRT